MARIASIEITNYRSIAGPLTLQLPAGKPLVIIGENNAGKSNVVRAFDMVLGQSWSGNHDPEDHEFYGRDRSLEVEVRARFDPDALLGHCYAEAIWSHNVVRAGESAHQVGPSQYANRRHDYMSNDVKSDCICVIIEADRNLNYHLSYASKWTFLSRLMHDFHKVLKQDGQTQQELEELFRQIKERFERVQEYADFSASLSEQLTGLSGNMTHRLDVSFQAYNPTNFFHALRLQALEGDTPRTLAELGTGEQQILALSFAYAYANAFHKGIVLVIEEPEAHLHPLAQQWLAKYMRELSEGGLQVILTTHSAHFIDIENIEGIVRIYKDPGGTKAVQVSRADLVAECVRTGVEADRVTVDNVLPFYSAVSTPQILEGLFAKVVLLVEGPTEALALPVYMESLGFIASREGIAVVQVGGKGNLGKWRRLFHLYGIPTYVVFDNDGRKDDKNAAKRTDALAAMGVPTASHAAIIESTSYIVEETYTVFPDNLEVSLRTLFPTYEHLEGNGREAGVDSKPFLARWVAERIEVDDSPGWKLMREFIERVQAIVPEQALLEEKAADGAAQATPMRRAAPRMH